MPLKSEFREVNRACWALDHNTRLDLRHELFLWDVGLHPSSNPSPNPPVFLPILCCCFLDHGLLCTIALGYIQKGEAQSLLFSLVMIFFYGAGDVFGHKNVLEIWYLLLGLRRFFCDWCSENEANCLWCSPKFHSCPVTNNIFQKTGSLPIILCYCLFPLMPVFDPQK